MLSNDPKPIGNIKLDDGTWSNFGLETHDLSSDRHSRDYKDVGDSEQSFTPAPRHKVEEGRLIK